MDLNRRVSGELVDFGLTSFTGRAMEVDDDDECSGED